MKKNKIYWFVGFSVIIVLIALCAYWKVLKKENFYPEAVSMEDIRERGTLNALVNYNSTDYFLYRGEPMGFQLELLENLAHELNLGLKLIPSNDIDTTLKQIHNTHIDLIASNVHITEVREEQIFNFTQPLFQTRQILIQRVNSSDKLVKSFGDLAGDTIYVPQGSIYESHLKHMRELSESDFVILALDGINEEQFVDWVADKKIDYTVVSENVATASKRYFNNIDGSFKLSFEQDIAWGISCDNDSLQIYVNKWIIKNKDKFFFRTLYDKYYVSPRPAYQSTDNYALGPGRISSFDPIIKKYAATLGWDWRLLASLIYQESHFIMQQVSSSGAIGLMQLMPDVAEKYNITLESFTATTLKEKLSS